MVVAGGTFFAFAISRSYFEVGGLPNGLDCRDGADLAVT